MKVTMVTQTCRKCGSSVRLYCNNRVVVGQCRLCKTYYRRGGAA